MTGTSPLGRYVRTDGDGQRCRVQLLATPLLLWQSANEHHDDLVRELALLSLNPGDRPLPPRLVELVELLGGRYGAAGTRPDPQRERALAEGLDRADLSYDAPISAGAAAVAFRALLDEVEEYCRLGVDLLTLQMPPVLARFSRWYIEQFQIQCDGGDPVPWPGPWTLPA